MGWHRPTISICYLLFLHNNAAKLVLSGKQRERCDYQNTAKALTHLMQCKKINKKNARQSLFRRKASQVAPLKIFLEMQLLKSFSDGSLSLLWP